MVFPLKLRSSMAHRAPRSPQRSSSGIHRSAPATPPALCARRATWTTRWRPSTAAEPMPSGNGWRAGESIPSETGSVVELLDLFMCHKMELFFVVYIVMLVLFLRRHLRMSLIYIYIIFFWMSICLQKGIWFRI